MPLINNPDTLSSIQVWLVLGAHIFLGTAITLHVLLYKRDSRGATGWIAFVLVFPFVGALVYALLGVNRVQTRARQLSGAPDHDAMHDLPRQDAGAAEQGAAGAEPDILTGSGSGTGTGTGTDNDSDAEASLEQVGSRATGNLLTAGNQVRMLSNGEQAYPAMLAAMANAKTTLYLTTYILDSDDTGRRFIATLADRVAHGVDVRVLLDGMGEYYSWPRASKLLRAAGVPVARFLPPRLLPPTLSLNLRTHRKVVLVDNTSAFLGGMNIGDRHLAERTGNPGRVVDLHFELKGPAVQDLGSLFLEDWHFVTGAAVQAPGPVAPVHGGTARCRVLADGPNEDMDRLTMTVLGAVTSASRHIRVMTPYFLPPQELVGALLGAAMRGVRVDVVLPGKNNLPYVQWASQHGLAELLQWGVRIWYQPAPFVHSKLLLVDDSYALVGSANLDPRSLRLNFEVGMEVFDLTLGRQLCAYFDQARAGARELSLSEMMQRPTWQRVRDGAAALFTPYL